MIDDIIFYSNEFFIELPTYSSGSVAFIEAQTEYFVVRLALPERISIL
jgi:hypothetical protein